MKIPANHSHRELFYTELILKAFSSRQVRTALYDGLKNYYLWGTNDSTEPVEYNKLYAHVDLLASFLFSGETTSFIIEIDEGIADDVIKFETSKAKILTNAVNKSWHRSNLDLIFNEALVWSLVFSTMFIKFVNRGKGSFDAYCVQPHDVGVLLEHESMLDKQPCIVHEFYMTKSDLEARCKGLSDKKKEEVFTHASFSERTITTTTTPSPINTPLMIAATTPNMEGNVINPIATQYDFNPQITEEVCTAQEVWVWDDEGGMDGKGDYRMALMLEGDYLFHDCEKLNPFCKKEQPFVKITPNQLYNFFWGRTEMMYLIPIQDWVNERIPKIKRHLDKQTDPPTSASAGFGFEEEKTWAMFNAPGGHGQMDQPGVAGTVAQHLPANVDVWQFLDRADAMFAEVSGIRDLMQGKGESGVRAMSHANLLVRVGSSRVKKKAAILEDSVEKCGHLVLKILQRDDPTQYKSEQGTSFVANQLTDNSIVKVDSHSSSPIFVEQQMDKGMALFKEGAADREDLIDAIKPQNAGVMKAKLREREKLEAAQKAKELKEEAKEGK
jgi:hypothetical protein